MNLKEILLKSATNVIDPEWHSEGYPSQAEVLIDLVLTIVADNIERTTIRIPFESEGYLAGAKNEHAGIVEYLRGLLDN